MMICYALFLVFYISASATHAILAKDVQSLQPHWNETYVDRLRQTLLLKYDKFSRPAQHYNTTRLYMWLDILHVEIDSHKSMMSTNTWVRMTWNDEKLKWNPQDFGGIKDVVFGSHEIWLPDLYLYNSAMHGVDNYESRHCVVQSDGQVTWTAPTVFHSNCKLNFIMWPFETNTCLLSIGSWSHSGDEIDLKLTDEGYDLQYYSAGEWKIQNVTAYRDINLHHCCLVPSYLLYYRIKLTRSSELYYHIIFVAATPLVLLILITFWLKPQSETRLVLNVSAIIIDIIFLLYLGYKVPARVDNIPLIVRFYSECLWQMTVSVVISCLVIHVSTNLYNLPISHRIRNILFGKFGKYIGLGSVIGEIESQKLAEQEMQETHSERLTTSDLSISGLDNGDQQYIISPSKDLRRLEWILLATAIDRLAFLFLFCRFIYIATKYIRINGDAFTQNHDFINSSSQSENLTSPDYF